MRAVIQRVNKSSVSVDGEIKGAVDKGFNVLLGVMNGDTEAQAELLAAKVAKLRIFEDENGKMNLSVMDVSGSVLMVSQFTLLGDARGQNRPGFTKAAVPEEADRLYQVACQRLREKGVPVETGEFRTHMEVALLNDGPVTILLDSRKLF